MSTLHNPNRLPLNTGKASQSRSIRSGEQKFHRFCNMKMCCSSIKPESGEQLICLTWMLLKTWTGHTFYLNGQWTCKQQRNSNTIVTNNKSKSVGSGYRKVIYNFRISSYSPLMSCLSVLKEWDNVAKLYWRFVWTVIYMCQWMHRWHWRFWGKPIKAVKVKKDTAYTTLLLYMGSPSSPLHMDSSVCIQISAYYSDV